MSSTSDDLSRRSLRCRACGRPNLSIDTWCVACGTYLDWEALAAPAVPTAEADPAPTLRAATTPDDRESPAPRRRASHALVPVAVILAALLLLGIGRTVTSLNLSGSLQGFVSGMLSHRHHHQLVVASVPSPTGSPNTVMARPAPTAAPTPTGGTAVAPQTGAAPPPAAPVQPAVAVDSSPVNAINRFYSLVTQHDFQAAAQLWSAHMQAEYPPATYINNRFAPTSYIGLQSARVTANQGGWATVSVSIVEVYDGTTRHWAGTWQLVRSGNGWLLNEPNLYAS